MGSCGCGFTTDEGGDCNGTHKVVRAVKLKIIADLKAKGFIEASESIR